MKGPTNNQNGVKITFNWKHLGKYQMQKKILSEIPISD